MNTETTWRITDGAQDPAEVQGIEAVEQYYLTVHGEDVELRAVNGGGLLIDAQWDPNDWRDADIYAEASL